MVRGGIPSVGPDGSSDQGGNVGLNRLQSILEQAGERSIAARLPLEKAHAQGALPGRRFDGARESPENRHGVDAVQRGQVRVRRPPRRRYQDHVQAHGLVVPRGFMPVRPQGVASHHQCRLAVPKTRDVEYRRVVLHEFGHALGLVHKHHHPKGKIPWDEKAVFAYYYRTQGWDETKTRQNVLGKYSEGETNFTEYDRTSIMQYPIPRELLTTSGFEVGLNSDLSELDKKFVREQYGNS